MKPASFLALLMSSLAQPAVGAEGQAVEPVEMAGSCRTAGIGRAFLDNAKAQALAPPECDRAVAIGSASLSFFRSGDTSPQLLFSGRGGTGRSFDVEIVRIGDGPVLNVISGNCLRNTFFITCHAIFDEGGVRKGIAVSFDLKRDRR